MPRGSHPSAYNNLHRFLEERKVPDGRHRVKINDTDPPEEFVRKAVSDVEYELSRLGLPSTILAERIDALIRARVREALEHETPDHSRTPD